MAPGYTAEEKKWLKKHWGSEFHFLNSYQLKIYNEEDREEGKAIMKALMECDTDFEDTGRVRQGYCLMPLRTFVDVGKERNSDQQYFQG